MSAPLLSSGRLLALFVIAAGAAAASPERHAPHERLREQLSEPAPALLERWFVPTELGHEPGTPPPEPGPRAFLSRAFWGSDRHDGGAWNARNQLRPQGQHFSHNLGRIFPVELFDTHPEFFPLIEGRRWRPETRGPVNWNPDLGEEAVAEHAAEAARRHFAQHPEAWSFALGTNDGLRYGESPATLRRVYPPRYYRSRPDYSDLVFNFMNRVAERVAPEYPDRHLGALAYYWAEQTPSFPVHPKVMPFLTADRSQGYDRAFRRDEEALQRRWAKAGPERLGIYDYVYGGGFLVPRIHTELLARHLRHARRAGFTDYFAETIPNWGLDGPQPWMVAQLLLDPERDHRLLLAEYYRRFFRGAARPMRRFFELCEERWMAQRGPSYWLKHYRSESQVSLYPPSVRRDLRALLDEAERAAAADPVALARVRLTSEAFRVSERLADLIEARDRLARALLAGGETRAGRSLDELVADDERARTAFRETLAEVRREQPLALGWVNEQDFLRSDWAPSARRRLRGAGDGGGSELIPDSFWHRPPAPDLVIAGLVYAPGMPPGWRSRSEPWQHMLARFEARPGRAERVLRLENHKLTILQTVVAAPAAGSEVVLAIDVAGHLGGETRLLFGGAWAGADGRPTEAERFVHLPPGRWPTGTRLVLAMPPAPSGTRLLGFNLYVTDQQAGDWLELSRPSIRVEGQR
jgi:hypothetical protein